MPIHDWTRVEAGIFHDFHHAWIAYESGANLRAWVEPIAVADSLPDMPLFLEPGAHVPVPLERTCQQAFEAVPRRWRTVLEQV